MAVNFTLSMPFDASVLGSRQPVLDGEAIEEKDQAPTGSWVEVPFTALAGLGARGLAGALVHISTDTSLRFAVAAAQPDAGRAGSQILAGAERTIGIRVNRKLWIK